MPPFTERKFIIKMLKKIQNFCFGFHAYYEAQIKSRGFPLRN